VRASERFVYTSLSSGCEFDFGDSMKTDFDERCENWDIEGLLKGKKGYESQSDG
jgi:hypothetical protein